MLEPPEPNPDAADCSPRFTIVQQGERTVIQLKAVKLPPGERLGVPAMLAFWLLFGSLAEILLFWSFRQGEISLLGLLVFGAAAALFILIGLPVLRWHWWRARRVAILIVTPDGLMVTESGFWGRREHHWPRADILDIRFANHPHFGNEIQITSRTQPPTGIVRSIYEWDQRWLVSALRKLLQLSPAASSTPACS